MHNQHVSDSPTIVIPMLMNVGFVHMLEAKTAVTKRINYSLNDAPSPPPPFTPVESVTSCVSGLCKIRLLIQYPFFKTSIAVTDRMAEARMNAGTHLFML